MEHITTAYGNPANMMEMTIDEFYTLKKFLEVEQVEIRMTSACGQTCIAQLQNTVKVNCLFSEEGLKAIEIAKRSIREGRFQR